MKSIIKGIAAVAACAMTVTGLAACGSSSASGEKKLDFITGMATGSVHLKTLQSITDAFEKENPGVKINLIPSSQDFTQDIKVRLAARNAPDLWNTHGWSRDRYADFLEPLQNRSWAGKMKDLTKEAFMEDDGTFYALPLDIQVTGVLYNKDVLDKVGVDPNSLNTWDEFNDACAKVKEAGLTCVVAGGKDTAIAGDLADLTASAWYDDAELKNLQSGKFDSSVYEKESGLIEGWKNRLLQQGLHLRHPGRHREAHGQRSGGLLLPLQPALRPDRDLQPGREPRLHGHADGKRRSLRHHWRGLGSRRIQDRQEQGHRVEVHRLPR